MARRSLTPSQWYSLNPDEQLEMLAYERWRDEHKAGLLKEITSAIQNNDLLIVAQAIILSND